MDNQIGKKITIEIDLGALTSAPIYEKHSRGKNWLAAIKRDPEAPAGLARQFCKPARGSEHFYMVAGLQVGDAVEFGADYYTGGGKKNSCRWYGIIESISETEMVLLEYPTAISACKAVPAVLEQLRQKQAEESTIQ